MGIGAGIFLIAVGAILTFAVNVTISGLDIAVIGVVLMVAGAAGIILDLFLFAPRRRQRVVYPDQSSAAYPNQASDVEVYDESAPARTPRFRRRVTTTNHRPMP